MNWNNGYAARYYYTLVDPASWRDLRRYELTGGNITKTEDGRMESASISLKSPPEDGESWIRIWLDARQENDGAHEALFTGIMSVPVTSWQGRKESLNAECYSVLQPAADILLPKGWYAPSGMDGASIAAELLEVGPAPVEYDENSPALSRSIVAESGESNLSMAQKIIAAIGWRIRISGSGVISIEERTEEIKSRFDSTENDCVELAVTDKRDWFSCPNVFRASSGDLTAIARDDDEDSALSTVSRGREIWKEENSVTLSDSESIEEYVARRLKEEQAPARIINYKRRFKPDVLPGDVVEINYPEQSVVGKFRVKTQKIELGYSARTSEEVEDL